MNMLALWLFLEVEKRGKVLRGAVGMLCLTAVWLTSSAARHQSVDTKTHSRHQVTQDTNSPIYIFHILYLQTQGTL